MEQTWRTRGSGGKETWKRGCRLPPWLRWHGPMARRVPFALFSALLVRRLKLPHLTAIRLGHATCFGPRK